MSEKYPLVSVIITNYNYCQYLSDSIDSALNQTYQFIEVIVIDDGSTDDSRAIISSYKNRIIPIFKDNGGQASAINAGFKVCQGNIISFLDADDIWLPNKVEAVVEIMSYHPGAVIAYHKIHNINKSGNKFGSPWPPYPIITGNISTMVKKTGGWWPWPPSSALSFSRPFLTQVMDIPEDGDFRFSAEPYLADIAPFFGDVAGIDRVLSLFRIHDNNTWSHPIDIEIRSLKNWKNRADILNNSLAKFELNSVVSLYDNWPYQLLRFKLGQEKNLIYLALLAYKNPWVNSFLSKIKTIYKLWLTSIGIGTSRL